MPRKDQSVQQSFVDKYVDVAESVSFLTQLRPMTAVPAQSRHRPGVRVRSDQAHAIGPVCVAGQDLPPEQLVFRSRAPKPAPLFADPLAHLKVRHKRRHILKPLPFPGIIEANLAQLACGACVLTRTVRTVRAGQDARPVLDIDRGP